MKERNFVAHFFPLQINGQHRFLIHMLILNGKLSLLKSIKTEMKTYIH